VAAGVRELGAETPQLGKIEHLGNDLDVAICLIRPVSVIVVKLGDVRSGDVENSFLADGRQYEEP
jgi:hypothetical protein